jgi:formylglycine-generating enzyme required for sulfatase activity
MKRFSNIILIMAAMSVLLSACNIPASLVATDMPIAATEPPTVTAVPPVAATEPPTATEAPLVTVNLAGPAMELGSKYKYVDGSILVAVPGGEFIMGYNAADNPVHKVTLSDFWIYSTKITNQQYATCVQAGKCSPPDQLNNPAFGDHRYINHPLTGVNYDQAASYCSFVHGRLPTESEWEKTARGPDGNLFPWGDEAPTCSLLNYKFCEGRTTAIDDYPDGISYYGAFDMSGNTREWVADWYSPTYYSESPVDDPLGPQLGEKRSVRGSSYQDSADPSISAHRFSLLPLENLPDLGFRCVVEDPTYFAPMCQEKTFIGPGPFGEKSDCTPDVKCNKVSISQAPNCTGKPGYIAYTIVTFSLGNTPPNAWTYDVPGCSSPVVGDVKKFQCNLPGPYTAATQGSCVDLNSCVSTCPAHYNKVGDACVWDGSGTDGTTCFAGSVYDPINHCCTAAAAGGVDFDLCPAGFYPLNNTCVKNPGASVDSELQTVLFATDTCHPPVKRTKSNDPGDGNTGACTDVEPVDGCRKVTGGQAPYWNPATCACESAPPVP